MKFHKVIRRAFKGTAISRHTEKKFQTSTKFIRVIINLAIPMAIPSYKNKQKNFDEYSQPLDKHGVPERIRTSDLPLRRGLRYPAVPPGLEGEFTVFLDY